MNVLFLNGSPRKNGSTATMMKKIQEGLDATYSAEWVDVYDLTIKPCLGCLRCRSQKGCALGEDDGHKVGEMIKRADVVVVGSPTYWSNMTGPLKILIDRNVTVFEDFSGGGFPKPLLKGKKVIVVNSSGAPWPFNSSGQTLRAIQTAFKNGGCKVMGIISHSGAGVKKEIPEKLLIKAKALGSRI